MKYFSTAKKGLEPVLGFCLLICLIGCGSSNTGKSSASSITGADEADSGNSVSAGNDKDRETVSDTAAVVGPYGRISVSIPKGWIAEEAPVDSDKLMYGLYGLILKPEEAIDGQIELFCIERFGVCGTGLSTKELELAGNTVRVGSYDNVRHWDFIVFGNDEPQIAAQHTDCSSWTEEMWDEAFSVLDTMEFDRSITKGGIGQYIPESENEEILLSMEVSHVSATGLMVHFRQYDDTGEFIYGEEYKLEKLEGTSLTAVPMVVEDAAFNDVGYTIPLQGESEQKIDWEWLYGKLAPGTYRISKTVLKADKSGASAASEYTLTAQFMLAGE